MPISGGLKPGGRPFFRTPPTKRRQPAPNLPPPPLPRKPAHNPNYNSFLWSTGLLCFLLCQITLDSDDIRAKMRQKPIKAMNENIFEFWDKMGRVKKQSKAQILILSGTWGNPYGNPGGSYPRELALPYMSFLLLENPLPLCTLNNLD